MNKINSQTPIYNNLSIRDILKRLNKKFAKVHRNLYIKNCIELYNLEKNKNTNLGLIECIKNSNFNLTLFYLNLK